MIYSGDAVFNTNLCLFIKHMLYQPKSVILKLELKYKAYNYDPTL
jgi:hypothetical protein